MTKIFFAAFAAAMMSATTMSANNKENTNGSDNPDVLPGVTVTAKKMSVEVIGTDNNKYEYNLDDNGRVSTRIAYTYNDISGKWTPCCAYTVFYGQDETVLTYAEYNSAKKTFNINPQQTRYNTHEYPIIINVPQISK